MSTSLYCNPLGHFLSKTGPQFKPETRKVKRSLFGPIDHVSSQKFLEEELERIRTTQSEKWNFDFQHEVPLSQRGGFQWKSVAPIKIKPRKRPINDFEGQDLYAIPDDVIRPTPIRFMQEKEEVTSSQKSHQNSKPQRLITGKFLTTIHNRVSILQNNQLFQYTAHNNTFST